ncbi:hypothetical protein BC828DRAFT_414841 [Blastocladiella britannica]|nr:hypothetical protein BC828DRAFT_414841 [Blastocladiella britannica]
MSSYLLVTVMSRSLSGGSRLGPASSRRRQLSRARNSSSMFLFTAQPNRTSEHKFGGLYEIGFFHIDTLKWYWKHFHGSREYFHGDSQHGLIWTLKSRTTLPILQWAIEQCAVLGDQKLTLTAGFIDACATDGHADMLDMVLCSMDVLIVDWTENIMPKAVYAGKLVVIEWRDRLQTLLPPQDLQKCAEQLPYAAWHVAADVLAWWHARQLPAPKEIWQNACVQANAMDALGVQIWLLDHLDFFAPELDHDRQQFMEACISALRWPKPHMRILP